MTLQPDWPLSNDHRRLGNNLCAGCGTFLGLLRDITDEGAPVVWVLAIIEAEDLAYCTDRFRAQRDSLTECRLRSSLHVELDPDDIDFNGAPTEEEAGFEVGELYDGHCYLWLRVEGLRLDDREQTEHVAGMVRRASSIAMGLDPDRA